VHDPESMVGWLQDEEEGEYTNNELVTGKWEIVDPPQLFQNRTALKYNKIFKFDNVFLQVTCLLVQLENGDKLLMSPSDNSEEPEVYKIKYTGTEEWVEIYLTDYQQHCLKCELEALVVQFHQEVVIDIGVPTLKIIGGVVAVAAAVPSGGASLSILGALGVSFNIIVGTYSTVSGMAELTLNFSNKEEWIEKIPGGYLNATIGMTIKYIYGDSEKTENIEFVLTFVEGVAVYNFKNPSDLQKLDNALSITNITISEIIK
jgi:hypothetical protein